VGLKGGETWECLLYTSAPFLGLSDTLGGVERFWERGERGRERAQARARWRQREVGWGVCVGRREFSTYVFFLFFFVGASCAGHELVQETGSGGWDTSSRHKAQTQPSTQTDYKTNTLTHVRTHTRDRNRWINRWMHRGRNSISAHVCVCVCVRTCVSVFVL